MPLNTQIYLLDDQSSTASSNFSENQVSDITPHIKGLSDNPPRRVLTQVSIVIHKRVCHLPASSISTGCNVPLFPCAYASYVSAKRGWHDVFHTTSRLLHHRQCSVVKDTGGRQVSEFLEVQDCVIKATVEGLRFVQVTIFLKVLLEKLNIEISH